MTTTGFHDGELAVQRQAGVLGAAARLEGMLGEADLDGGLGRFLAGRSFAVLAGRDGQGRPWTSPLTGPAGFLSGHGTTLDIAAAPGPGDPLAGLPAGQPVGLIAIDFETRRRMRVNGTLVAAGAGRLQLAVEQVYGNCPQYIRRRTTSSSSPADGQGAAAQVDSRLSDEQVGLVVAAETFFLGTAHPARGTDASHRGGPVGFVRVEDGGLWWPDYPGNNMFNSLGNLTADPAASLLFLDFSTGHTLHLSGRAVTEWVPAGSTADEGGTGRRVRFWPDLVVAPTEALGLVTG
jgi:uncharacterized protein